MSSYITDMERHLEHQTVISEHAHQSPPQREEYKFIHEKLPQWFHEVDNYFHKYESSFIGDKDSDNNRHAIITTRLNLSVILRTICKKECEGYEAGFTQALETLLKTKAGTGKKEFLAIVVGSQIKFFQDRDGYINGLDGTDAESVQAIDFSTDKGAEEAGKEAAYIKEECAKMRNVL
ncbi:hypothetical protein EMCG_01252 [[Emmonsia] crescens]|uniref:Uncharacterized protein n=1 Tax=[Emmonsia] crescens TaxID=73230 RepID=A0A0G2I616_9EURO|nr:hypothetical protein EMCG_01252 [Emmonsia crescens UAMH 3008]